ncbi:DUF4307 domain-containing protein [Nocardia paucivorans]|uniref:DUF4307 domain-containing protein n=1 Tax=Nocardia paucivorans TaxID=114259 RepID=UPI00030F1506|nr:DUF4307 domain-containing protein [Nocardia paucivorans]
MTEPTPETARANSGDTAPESSGPAGGSDARARYADRYGTATRAPGSRRLLALLMGVVVVAAGIGVAYLGWTKFGPEEIGSEQLGYTVLDDSTIRVRIKVTRADPSKAVVCVLRAMDQDVAEVGRREVLIQPSEHGTVEVTSVIKTTARPSTGTIYTCTDKVPAYLRTE